jgi:hypothetical protein
MSKDLHLLAQGLNGFSHPIRIKALVLFEREHSPSEITRLLMSEPLGVVSYHVRMLKDYGLVDVARTAPKRGALEHFYRRTALADVLMETLAELLGIPPRPKGKGGRPPGAAKLAERADERERELLIALGIIEPERAAA